MGNDCCAENRTVGIKAMHAPRNEALSAVTWGAALLWGGSVWLAHETGVLAASGVPVNPEALFFLGFGFIVAVAIAVSLLVPGFKRADFFSYVLAVGAIGLGLSSWTYTWPTVLAVLGVVLIVGSVRRLGNTD